MKIMIPKKEEEIESKAIESDEAFPPLDKEPIDLPEEKEEAPRESNENEKLRLELAELRGQVSVLRSDKDASSVDLKEQQELQTKQKLMADMNGLDDDQFRDLYRMTKIQASQTVMQYDMEKEKTKSSQKIAELEAKNDLIAKYPAFSKHYDKVRDVISDLSPEARQNPDKVKKVLEREFLLIQQEDKPVPKGKESDMKRRTIVNDFERPSLGSERKERKDDQDLIAESDRELAAHFGLKTESERKKYTSPYIPMDLGVDPKDGKRWMFDDPKKGPVKVANS